MTLTDSRSGAVGAALRDTVGQPLRFFPVVVATAVMLAVLLAGGIALWRLQPLEAPTWVRPQALVLAAGAEGETDLAALGLALRKVSGVAAADFIGRDAALADLAQRPGLASLGLRELRPNPLPDAFVVSFAADSNPDAVDASVAALARLANVESVHYQPDAYRRAWALARLGRRLLLLAAAAVVAAAVIGVAAIAALRIPADPQELRLLDMLGADPAAVRRPHVYGGALSLLAASALAWWITVAAGNWLDPLVADLARHYALHWSTDPLPAWCGPVFCGLAAVLGGLLASFTARWEMRAAIRR